MKTLKKKIAILSGDGIGPEVMESALLILEKVSKRFQLNFELIEGLIGGAAFDQYQTHCPKETLALCKGADAI